MKRRAASAEETRQRIVRATAELHAERGLAETSFRDIAERADVAVGSVYHHFPTYDDVIRACGQHTTERWPHPDESIFADLDDPAERLGRLAEEVFGYYERFPGYRKIVADRDRFPIVERFFRDEEALRRRLIREAIGPIQAERSAVGAASALLSFGFFEALRRNGLSLRRAGEEAASQLCHRLLNR